MIMKVVVVLLLGALSFCSGQQRNENATDPENCFFWYYDMPPRIECREGMHFSTACQVRVPCGVETDIEWYWSPVNSSNATLLITDSDSNGVRVRALTTSRAMCNHNTSAVLQDLYTLTLAGLNSEHAGYYWCQMKIISSEISAADHLLPSNRCYIGVRDTTAECDYGEHRDTWTCALKEMIKSSNSFSEQSYSIGPSRVATQSTSPHPTVDVTVKGGPCDSDRDHPVVAMSVTTIEVIFLVVIVVCVVIMAFLVGCLVCKHRKRREGTDSALAVAEKQWRKKRSKPERNAVTPEGPNPRYTPVNTLTRTLSFPQLASDWYRHHSNKTLPSEAIYSSPYQHLDPESLDYTSMYSKPHQHAEMAVQKSANCINSAL